MNKFSVIFFTVFILFQSGCATVKSDYHPLKKLEGGYSELDMHYGVYYIEYQGNEWMEPEKAENYALLRAAELVLENGYPYFMVRNHRTDLKIEERSEEYEDYERDCVFDECDRLGRDRYRRYTVKIPITRVTIASFREKPADSDTEVLDAHGIRTKIRQKYGLVNLDGTFS